MNNKPEHSAETDIDRRLRALTDAVCEAVPDDNAADVAALAKVFGQARALVVPMQRTIVAVDIEGSTRRTNTARAQLRNAMYNLLDEALAFSDIGEQHRDYVDRGDGAFVLIHPVDHAPKTVLLTMVIPTLTELLAQHEMQRPGHGFRLRVAVHAGEVHYDNRGWYGEDLDITARLLDAPELKRKFKLTRAPLILVVSQDIYRSVVRHGYDGIDDTRFVQTVHFQIGGHRQRGWVQIPGEDAQSGATAG